MYLTLSKKFEISFSHRLFRPEWSEAQNLDIFGDEARGEYGHGHNYAVYFVFHGPVDSKNGMMLNVAVIKQRIKRMLDERYDHKFLNLDTPPFDKITPTPENMAAAMLQDALPLFASETTHPVACHIVDEAVTEATAYNDGRVERHYWIDFSAARSTRSPHLSEEENQGLFGIAASPFGHGHHYRLRITVTGEINHPSGLIMPEPRVWHELKAIRRQFDHKHLNHEIDELKNLPITTEILARVFFDKLAANLPVQRVKLYENDRFFVECVDGEAFRLGIVSGFSAAHRLNAESLSELENRHIYGKCNNSAGHGHHYKSELTIQAQLDEKSGAMYDLMLLQQQLDNVLQDWRFRHLDRETDDFKSVVTTGENILTVLWGKLERKLSEKLFRLRLWETPNNRFTLRQTKGIGG